jgi:hypothetical protein
MDDNKNSNLTRARALVKNTPFRKYTIDEFYLSKGLVPCRCNPKEFCSLCNATGYRKPRLNKEKPKTLDANMAQLLIVKAKKKTQAQKAAALRVLEEAKEQLRARADAEQNAVKRKQAKNDLAKNLAAETRKKSEEAKRLKEAAKRAWTQNPRLFVAKLLSERTRKFAPVRFIQAEEQVASKICYCVIEAEMLLVNKSRSKYQTVMSDLAWVKEKAEQLKMDGTNPAFWVSFVKDADRLHREMQAGMPKPKPTERQKDKLQYPERRVAHRLQQEQKKKLTHHPKSSGRGKVLDAPNGDSMRAAFDNAYQSQKDERTLDGTSGTHVFRDHGEFGSQPSFDASDPDE